MQENVVHGLFTTPARRANRKTKRRSGLPFLERFMCIQTLAQLTRGKLSPSLGLRNSESTLSTSTFKPV